MISMKAALLPILAAIASLAGCSRPPAPTPARTDILAVVGTRTILVADLAAEAARRLASHQSVPDKAALLDEMVGEEAHVQRALALKLDADPEVARTIRGALIGALRTRELEPRLDALDPPAADIAARYEMDKPRLQRPERARLGIIFGALPSHLPAEAAQPVRERLQQAQAAAAAGPTGFSEAAARYSDHQSSRYRGGDAGWITRGAPPRWLPAAVAEAAFSLRPGQVSGIIQAETGLYLITMLEHAPSAIPPLKEVEPGLRAALVANRQAVLRADYQRELRAAAGTRIFEPTLETVVLPTSPAALAPPDLAGTASN